VLLFEKSRVERENGENVLFSWWLTEEDERKVLLKEEEQFADVFDEDNEVLIIMDLRGVREESIQVKVDRKSATILFRDSNGIEHARQTPLPADVNIAEFRQQFQNQTLIISIPKNEE
ncbi:MAG: Hsp20/alpha crystallin family protein, partial [Mangrovibacterium sp.]